MTRANSNKNDNNNNNNNKNSNNNNNNNNNNNSNNNNNRSTKRHFESLNYLRQRTSINILVAFIVYLFLGLMEAILEVLFRFYS